MHIYTWLLGQGIHSLRNLSYFLGREIMSRPLSICMPLGSWTKKRAWGSKPSLSKRVMAAPLIYFYCLLLFVLSLREGKRDGHRIFHSDCKPIERPPRSVRRINPGLGETPFWNLVFCKETFERRCSIHVLLFCLLILTSLSYRKRSCFLPVST